MEREFTMEEGKAGDEVVLDSPDMKFGDKAIRRGFIRKVYMILSVQVRNKSVKFSWEFYWCVDKASTIYKLLLRSLCTNIEVYWSM